MSEPTRIEPKIVHGEVSSAELARYPLTTTEDRGIRPHRREQAMSEELRAALAEELEFRFGGLVSGETEDWQRAAREIVRSGPVQDALAALSQPRQEDGLRAAAVEAAEWLESGRTDHAEGDAATAARLRAALSQPRQEDGLDRAAEVAAALAEVGLPPTASVATLIRHHRANEAAAAGARAALSQPRQEDGLDALRKEGDGVSEPTGVVRDRADDLILHIARLIDEERKEAVRAERERLVAGVRALPDQIVNRLPPSGLVRRQDILDLIEGSKP